MLSPYPRYGRPKVLGINGKIGTLVPGSSAHVSVLRWNEKPVPLADTPKGIRTGPTLEAVVNIRVGRVFKP